MPNVAREGDKDTGGGTIVGNYSPDVFVNGKSMAHVDSTQSPHPPHPKVPIHGSSHIIQGAGAVFVNNKPVAFVGSQTVCGHPVASGSPNVFVGEQGPSGGAGNEAGLPEEYSPAATAAVREVAGRYAPLDDPDSVGLTPSSYGNDTNAPPVKTPTDANVVTQETATPLLPGCSSIDTAFYEENISPNFKLKNYSTSALFAHAIQAQAGFTISGIVCNLKALSNEVIEKINTPYPNLRINSGFRKVTKGTSQHEKGMACDIQWPGLSPADYLIRAKWIAENLIFDQLIFEHGNSIWLHLSFNRTATKQRKQILTMINGTYQPGLKLYY